MSTTSIKPPTFLGIRYQYLFYVIQLSNLIRYNICPDWLNYRNPTSTYITSIIIGMPHAIACLIGMETWRKKWDLVQNCMIIVIVAYLSQIIIAIFNCTNATHEMSWHHIHDQAIYWHEVFFVMTLYTLAKAEGEYLIRLDHLDKIAAEYGTEIKPIKYTRRFGKNEENGGKQA